MSRVHILATVLNRDLLANSRLIFRTLRLGFPTSEIVVHGNSLDQYSATAIKADTESIGGEFVPGLSTSHGEWIEFLLRMETEPFWIADTDVIFFEPVEHWFAGSKCLFSGRMEPEFLEPWTRSVHVERLHPSLMWFNPAHLRAAIRSWPGTTEFFHTVQLPLVQWTFVPRLGKPMLFYDTCAGLHHALGGQPFSEGQNKAFSHLFCGTYADQNTALDLTPVHAEIIRNPELARNLWASQQEWYKRMAVPAG